MRAGVPAHRASTSADFVTDSQLAHRSHLIRLPHPLHGEVVVEGPRYALSATPGARQQPGTNHRPGHRVRAEPDPRIPTGKDRRPRSKRSAQMTHASETSVPVADDWTATWAPMVAATGTDLSHGRTVRGADPIERSTVRRYLEPLEFDCALHYDPEVAREHGFRDVTAPYTSVLTFTIPAMWEPGQHLFTSDDKDAQPAFSPINGDDLTSRSPVDRLLRNRHRDGLRASSGGRRPPVAARQRAPVVPSEVDLGRPGGVHDPRIGGRDGRRRGHRPGPQHGVRLRADEVPPPAARATAMPASTDDGDGGAGDGRAKLEWTCGSASNWRWSSSR